MKEQQLNDLSIFSLRELARRTGVNSPTSKRKNQLIEEIMAIREGRQQPINTSSRQGRPPKGFILDIDEVIHADNKVLTLNQNDDDYNAEKCIVSGYVEKLNNNVGFLWVKEGNVFKNYFIPMSALGGNVLSGDFVSAEMLKNADGMVAKKVIDIDGVAVESFNNRLNFDSLEHKLSTKNICLNSEKYKTHNFMYGENIFIYGNNNNEKTSCVIDILNNCDADAKIYINHAMVDKSKIFLKNINNAEVFTTSMMDEIDYAKRITTLVVERAKRFVEMGKSCVIAIDDVLTMASIDLNMIKQLISTTKNTKEGSITIFAVMSKNEKTDIFEKLADKKLLLTKSELVEIE